ncbi:MAG: transcription factor FapR [Desulfotomaculum sp.]|nr:transcription factor FapR [Desulfotomaculum sp.]
MSNSTTKLGRHKQLNVYIKDNPFLTDEDLAALLGVSVPTIRLDRLEMKIPELRERIKHLAKGDTGAVKSLLYGEIVGELVEIVVGKSGTSLLTITPEMVFKRNLIARGHHLFAQANSLAIAIMDATTALTGSVKASFRKQVKVGERVVAEANIISVLDNRYKVAVISKVKGLKVFEAMFTVFLLVEEEPVQCK